MKKFILLFSAIFLFSCSKKESGFSQTISDSTKIIESLNLERTKINDSIRLKNNRNIFADLSGTHSLKFSSDEGTINGKINFEKTGRDLYKVSGSGKSEQNIINI